MAVEPLDSAPRIPIPRQGRIRRCRVRHVSILPAGDGPRVQVDCLLDIAGGERAVFDVHV